jgi:hypothetical protein
VLDRKNAENIGKIITFDFWPETLVPGDARVGLQVRRGVAEHPHDAKSI